MLLLDPNLRHSGTFHIIKKDSGPYVLSSLFINASNYHIHLLGVINNPSLSSSALYYGKTVHRNRAMTSKEPERQKIRQIINWTIRQTFIKIRTGGLT